MTSNKEKFERLFKQNQDLPAPLLDGPLEQKEVAQLDLSRNNPRLEEVNIANTEDLEKLIEELKGEAAIGIGGYDENRSWYQRSPLFSTSATSPRCIHLGTDVWATAGTPIHAPLEGTLHSLANNNNFGDYGGTLILEHQIEDLSFYTLYGHLSIKSLEGKTEGQKLPKGSPFCKLGAHEENGNWPPHLHFQILLDLEGRWGDFPGVCTEKDREHYLAICPDPSYLLK